MDPVVVEFTMLNKRVLYEMGTTIEAVIRDTDHGCPIEMVDVDSYRQVPLEDVQRLFGTQRYQQAYDCVTNPDRPDVCFMGRVHELK